MVSSIAIIVSLVAAIVSTVVAVALVFIYRDDVKKAAKRKDDQATLWGIELGKVSGVLEVTQKLLEAQQDSNKIILDANERLARQGVEGREEIKGLREEIKGLREEVRGLREQLRQMTQRAEVAEDKADGVD